MEINKILNNNVIVVKDDHGFEKVAMGKGIGFKRSAGEQLDPTVVDKFFSLQNDDMQSHFSALMAEVPYEILRVTEQFIDQAAKQLGQKLNASLHVSLVDHIYHALKRYEEGQLITNSLVYEIRNLYAKEFMLSKHFLEIVATETNVHLPLDEAGFVAMHLINAEMNEEMGTTIEIMKEVYAMLNIIKYAFHGTYDEHSLNDYRLLTHLKFFVQRIIQDAMLQGNDLELYLLMKQKHPDAYQVCCKIANYVANTFGMTLTTEEMLYLMIHLNRLQVRASEREDASP